MVNYNNGKIYNIVCNTTGLIYVGSTTKEFLSQRLDGHRSVYRCWKLDNTKTYMTSFRVLENDNFKIVLIEAVNCNSNNELHTRERFYIESTDCVNHRIPNRTIHEYRDTNRDKINKKQNEKNAEKNAENRDEINKKQNEKRDANKDAINKKAREKYAEKKREYMERYPLLFRK